MKLIDTKPPKINKPGRKHKAFADLSLIGVKNYLQEEKLKYFPL